MVENTVFFKNASLAIPPTEGSNLFSVNGLLFASDAGNALTLIAGNKPRFVSRLLFACDVDCLSMPGRDPGCWKYFYASRKEQSSFWEWFAFCM